MFEGFFYLTRSPHTRKKVYYSFMGPSIFDLHGDITALTPQEKVVLRFMETAISRINSCLIGIRAVQELLIEKGIVDQATLEKKLRAVEDYPDIELGRRVLEEMIRQSEIGAASDHPPSGA
jgi:hypothetical protein